MVILVVESRCSNSSSVNSSSSSCSSSSRLLCRIAPTLRLAIVSWVVCLSLSSLSHAECVACVAASRVLALFFTLPRTNAHKKEASRPASAAPLYIHHSSQTYPQKCIIIVVVILLGRMIGRTCLTRAINSSWHIAATPPLPELQTP